MAKVLFLFLFLILSLTPRVAQAEYRAYRLSITKEGQSREVISNLDQLQYPGYYPLATDESIEYVDSWMCWERQGVDVPPCPDPKSLPAENNN